MSEFLKRRPFYLTTVILLMMLWIEFWVWWLINSKEISSCIAVSMVVAGLAIVVLLIVGSRLRSFLPVNKRIISKFISNSVEGGIHHVILLFVFILQFTWFVDSLYDVVVKSDVNSLLKAVPSAFAMFLLIFIIPNIKIRCELNNKKLLITPISGLAKRNLDLICYPFFKNVYDTNRDFRADNGSSIDEKERCQLIELDECVVIPSDKVLADKFDDIIVELIHKKENDPDSDKRNLAKLLSERIMSYNSDNHGSKCKICIDGRRRHLGDILRLYVKLFYSKEVTFHITPATDYNSLDSVFESCRKVLDKHEVEPAETLLYISPGPSCVAGGLCLYGIKRGRHLLYYEQTDPGHLVAFEPDVSDRNLSSFIADIADDMDNTESSYGNG
ncbi:MAG: hypothetical protein IJ940_02730 [Bacteroidales bacterium]|nr:hypothetical protein [Bacteroidales bacterium]